MKFLSCPPGPDSAREAEDDPGAPAREGLPYAPVAVRVGLRQGGWAEVLSGPAPGDRVVTRGGIGFLYPDFKSQGSD